MFTIQPIFAICTNDGPFSTPHWLQSLFCVSEIFLLDKMNRKTVPVSSSTLRRRTRVDVDKRLKQIQDDCTDLTDFQMTAERDLGDVSGESPTCSDTATGVVFSEEEGGMEVDEDI